MEIIQRNLKIMNLKIIHSALWQEGVQYTIQYNMFKNNQFDVDKFRNLCYIYNFINFIRETGTWRKLFDKNNKNIENEDLLSRISI